MRSGWMDFGIRMHDGSLNHCPMFVSTYTETNRPNKPLCVECALSHLHESKRPLWQCDPFGDRWHSARCACAHFIDLGFEEDLPRDDWEERWEAEHLEAIRPQPSRVLGLTHIRPLSDELFRWESGPPGVYQEGLVWKCATCIHRGTHQWSRWRCNLSGEWPGHQQVQECPEYLVQPVQGTPGFKDAISGPAEGKKKKTRTVVRLK